MGDQMGSVAAQKYEQGGRRISDEYIALQKDLHARFNYGHGVDAIECADLVRSFEPETVLDYGCGQGHLAKLLAGLEVEEYDPCIEGKDGEPAKADVVVCADVLEHIEPECLGNVLLHLYAVTRQKLILVIAIAPSKKVMADGRQAHLIVQPADWWQSRLTGLFDIERFEDRSAEGKGVLAVVSPRRFTADPPLLPIARIRSITAVTDAERNDNVIANCARTPNRLQFGISPNDRVAHLACFGPSLRQTWPELAMALHHEKSDVFSVSGAHRFLIDRGVIPFAHMDCDPRAHKAEQIGEPDNRVRYWLASCVHPSYLDKTEGHQVDLWHSYNGEASRIAFKIDPKQKMIIGGGSIGLRAMSVLYARGYRRFEIHGMDCSFQDGENHAGAHLGKQSEGVPVKCGERWFETSAVLILYARFFQKQLKMMPDAEINLHGDGLLQHMIRCNQTGEQE
jgi:hypothetical protein